AIMEVGVDAINTVRLNNYLLNHRTFSQKIIKKLNKTFTGIPNTFPYKIMSKYFIVDSIDSKNNVYPSVIPGWDHTPRSGKEGLVMTNSNPKYFKEHLRKALKVIENKDDEHKILFIKSWNEWAEGNYMEP